MPIRKPIVAEIANKVYCINEFGLDAMFLIVGAERALLVDTGTGLFKLPALIKRLTDKPCDVALTHGHVDHAGGIGWFQRIYLHPEDFAAAAGVTPESRRGYAAGLLGMADGLFDRRADDVVVFENIPEMLPLTEGHVFDLGGRRVQVYETPGHTPGGLSFLIEDARILLSGDACNPNTLMFPFRPDGSRAPHASIEGLLETARKIESLSPLYDRNYNGHVGFGPIIEFLPMAESLTREVIALCEALLAGQAGWEPNPGGSFGLSAIARFPHGQIQFIPEFMRE